MAPRNWLVRNCLVTFTSMKLIALSLEYYLWFAWLHGHANEHEYQMLLIYGRQRYGTHSYIIKRMQWFTHNFTQNLLCFVENCFTPAVFHGTVVHYHEIGPATLTKDLWAISCFMRILRNGGVCPYTRYTREKGSQRRCLPSSRRWRRYTHMYIDITSIYNHPALNHIILLTNLTVA
jgi:hypothetical protein